MLLWNKVHRSIIQKIQSERLTNHEQCQIPRKYVGTWSIGKVPIIWNYPKYFEIIYVLENALCNYGNMYISIGEGNGTPLQCSCLENPIDGGAWWAAVHGVVKVGHDWATSLLLFTFMHWRRKWQPTPVFLPGESQGRQSLMGCHLWGRTESDTTEVT